MSSKRNDIAVRSALLRYYSSECSNHNTYILTLCLVFFGWLGLYFGVLDSFFKTLIYEIFIRSLVLSLTWVTFIVGLVYLFLRTMLWGYLASAIFRIPQEQWGGVDFESLHLKCYDYVRGKCMYGRKQTFGQKMASKVSGGHWKWVIVLLLFFWSILFLFLIGLWNNSITF